MTIDSELQEIMSRRRQRDEENSSEPTQNETPVTPETPHPAGSYDTESSLYIEDSPRETQDSLASPQSLPSPQLRPDGKSDSNELLSLEQKSSSDVDHAYSEDSASPGISSPQSSTVQSPRELEPMEEEVEDEIEEEEEEEVGVQSPPQFSPINTPSPMSSTQAHGHSSSDEEVEIAPSAETETDEEGTGSSSSVSNEEQVDYEPPPAFDMSKEQQVDYEPPPAFDMSPPVAKPDEDRTSILDSPPRMTEPAVCLRSWPLLETSTILPATNPLTGNLVVCKKAGNSFVIYEFEARTRAVVTSVPLLSPGVRRRMASLYKSNVVGVSKVVSVSSGVELNRRRPCVRVAVLVDYQLMSYDEEISVISQRAIAVWQWRDAPEHQDTALQSIIKPPSANSGSYYSPSSLVTAGGLCFFSGYVRDGSPCVLVSRAVEGSWSSTTVGPSGSIVTAMAATSTTDAYLATALTDGSVGVWHCSTEVDEARMGGDGTPVLSQLYRLESTPAPVSPPTAASGEEETKQIPEGHCTHLQWTVPDLCGDASLLMLGVVYLDGVAAFHVSVPKGTTPSNGTGRCPTLDPFAVGRLTRPGGHNNSVVWLNLGPHCSPFLGVLCDGFEDKSESCVCLYAIDLPQCSSNDSSMETTNGQIRAVCETPLSRSSSRGSSHIFGLNDTGSIACYSDSRLLMLSPSLSSSKLFPETEDPYFFSLRRPVLSEALGLDSSGSVLSSRHDVLFVCTVTHFKAASIADGSSSVSNDGRVRLAAPTQRHWLCRIHTGDTADVGKGGSKTSSHRPKPVLGYNEKTRGGSITSVVCELKSDNIGEHSGSVPHRIARCGQSEDCAVLFMPSLGDARSSAGVSVKPCMFALLDTETDTAEPLSYHDGRDVIFLPKGHDENVRALFLSKDGSLVHLLSRDIGTGNREWKESPLFYPPFLGITSVNEYSEGCRLFHISTGAKSGLILVGSRIRDGQMFVSRGKLIDPTESEMDGWSTMLPDLKSDPVLWLKPGEDVVSLCELADYGSTPRCIAIATHQRVMITSLDLEIVSETSTRFACGSLASIGSNTVAYCSLDSKIRYICSLKGKFSNGVLATLPCTTGGKGPYSLIAVRPDRVLYISIANAPQLLHPGENEHLFRPPLGVTKPALCLEPLIANALCARSSSGDTDKLVHIVTEKFGRKLKSFAHADDEGTGNLGSGLTNTVFEMLSSHGFKDEASWLLTGNSRFDRASTSKFLPAWASMPSKASATPNNDAVLQLVGNGDQYLSDYVKSPDQNMVASLPRSSDPSAEYSMEFARQAIQEGSVEGGLKLLDFAGFDSTESDLLLLSLALGLDPFSDNGNVLETMCGCAKNGSSGVASSGGSASSIAALVVDMRTKLAANGEVKEERSTSDKDLLWMKLAPSVQRSLTLQRSRLRLIGENASRVALAGQIEATKSQGNTGGTPYNESIHIWNEGPFKRKENLLVLDRMEEWLGRSRPSVLGEEGASAAFDRGEKKLADILAKAHAHDDDSFAGQSETSHSQGLGWVPGIGEGRSDEDNISAYFRMSEGADQDEGWKRDGLSDLTTFQHRGVIVDVGGSASLQPTTSNVDEGESGKVKVLFDLVYGETSSGDHSNGMVVEVLRGGSLDVGMLHEPSNDSRKKCSIEFWYHLPPSGVVSQDVVLVRRSVCAKGEELSKCCIADDKSRMLWELVMLPSGELEYRSRSGSSLLSTSGCFDGGSSRATSKADEFADGTRQEDVDGLVSWQRQDGSGGWNHVCLVFSSRQHANPTICTVSIIMNGSRVASKVTSISLPGLSEEDHTNWALVNDAMDRTALGFCINPVAALRITEIRIWSCERSEEDCKMMMYEYLPLAETKRKLKVKIRTKRRVISSELSSTKPLGGLLAPPPGEGVGRRGQQRVPTTTEHGDDGQPSDFRPVFEGGERGETDVTFASDERSGSVDVTAVSAKVSPSRDAIATSATSGENTSGALPSSPSAQPSTLRSSALTLSEVVRRSAAAALIRGPPATRHFGGNRGGIASDLRTGKKETRRCGVGAIAICGAEKTVVFAHEKVPPGRTYPIGASGAVISDEMDDDGSEYLCCFLAKDKRMVLFELSSKTVIVELQMTTKLNFWRYLPPEAHGHTLVFMIVTPVGGFHWTPLDAAPRPMQVWKRGPDLQGKKIIVYEEGGSNGLSGADARSAVALLLASVSTSNPVEAWIMPVCGDSRGFCVSNNVMGAALCHPLDFDGGQFLPSVITATMDLEADLVIEILPLTDELSNGAMTIGEAVASVKLTLSPMHDIDFLAPSLAMGSWPPVICCSFENIIVVAVRQKGLVAAYVFNGNNLEMTFCESVGHFVVDAAVRSCSEANSRIEIVLLVCDNDNSKDGRVQSIFLQ